MPELDDSSLLELLDLTFDALCASRVSDWVDPDRVLAAVDLALTPERVKGWHARLVAPVRTRLLTRAAKSRIKLEAWLPAEASASLSALLGQPVHLPRKAIDEMVASEQVRETVRTTLQETLSALVSKVLAGAPVAGVSGLRDALSWGARAAASAGKGILGGLGGSLQDRVREVIDGSMALVQRRIAERLASEETARALGARRQKVFLSTLEKTEAEAAQVLSRFPHEHLDSLVPQVIAHNLARPEVREGLKAELHAVLEDLSRHTVGELLDQAGLRDATRQWLHAHGLPFARTLAHSAPFIAWRHPVKRTGP
ncbi:hypothetical protein [Corallococcus exiguus]|uniref:Uncharacterized protein n=1 Tax=Corallococcus exiguus TaxID=83462 RepID=A0A7X4Y9K1_9BACT|nr:hypothetical protein [Corallococcus exiguus]NBC41316.1 hypothetical protein [Corallococcus exiguus]TNV66931.1 hypothetical protein FH620_03865 [Corallococcus exiguus]